MAEERTKSELDLLQTVQDEQVISQAALSERMGIATGLVNFLMKRAISKGFVIAKRVPARRYAYFLTPKGMIEKARLVADYMNTSLHMYRDVRRNLVALFEQPNVQLAKHIVVVGDVELAELVILAGDNCDRSISAIIAADTNRKSVLSVPVLSRMDLAQLEPGNILFIVADIYNAQKVYDELVSQYGAKAVLAIDALCVKPADHTPYELPLSNDRLR